MTQRVRTACVGCGDLALRGILPHLAQPDARERIDLVAVCDLDADRAQTTAERFSIPRAVSDYERLLDDPTIDMLLLLTPIHCHADQAVRALQHGKHVYLQKPIATTLAEAHRVVEVSRECDALLLVAPVQRLCPLVERLHAVLLSGEIGTPFWALTATHWPATYDGSGFDRSWHFGAAGGPVRDRTIYSLTTLVDLFGAAQRVTALSTLSIPARSAGTGSVAATVDDNTVMLLGFDRGMHAVATGNYCVDGRHVPAGFLGVYGSRGSVETTAIDPDSWYPTAIEIRSLDTSGHLSSRSIECPSSEVPGQSGEHLRLPEKHVYIDILHLAQSVLTGQTPLSTASQACHIVEIIDKSYLAAQTGVTQNLNTVLESS